MPHRFRATLRFRLRFNTLWLILNDAPHPALLAMRSLPVAALFILSTPFLTVAQPTGQIVGTVTDAGGQPLEGINIYLDHTSLGAASNTDGMYRIEYVPAGSYTLIATGVGLRAQKQAVSVWADSTVIADFLFNETYLSLPEVEIIGRWQKTYMSAYTFAASKTATHPLDVPQALSTVTKELMDDRQVIALPEVLENVSAVHQNTSTNDVTIRGFRSHLGPTASGYRLLNGLRSGYGYFTNPLLINIERVEVLKGPGSALYGAINPGGTVNLVTKKPLEVARKAVSFSSGSFNTLRAALDVTGPLNDSRTLLYRLNVGFEKTDTFKDFNNHTAFSIAPTVTFAPTDRTTLNAELVYSHFDGFLNRGLAVPAQNLDDVDRSRSLSQPSDWYRVEDVYLHASLTHRLTDDLSLNLAFLRFVWDEDLGEHRTLNRWKDNGVQLISAIRYWERLNQTQTNTFSAFLTLRHQTGPLRHTVVAGADWLNFYTDGGTVWEARSRRVPVEREITTTTGETVTVTEIVEENLTFDLRNPVYRHRRNDIATYVFRKNRDIGDREEEYQTVGLYVQDQIALSNRLTALVGLRYELYRDVQDWELPEAADGQSQAQNIFVPRFGLVGHVTNHVNVYAHYSRGFNPISPVFIFQPEQFRPDGATASYKHETSQLLEVGAKAALLNRRLVATLAAFRILKQNVLQKTGEVNTLGNEVLDQLGEIKSEGLELEIVGQMLPNVSVNAHYTFNPTEVVETDEAAQLGKPLWGAPKHRTGLWVRYIAEEGPFAGIGVGLGVQHAASRRHRFISTNLETGEDGFAHWPTYTVVDGAFYYTVNQFKLAVNLKNLFNTRYWIGGFDHLQAFPGTPFHVITSVGYTF